MANTQPVASIPVEVRPIVQAELNDSEKVLWVQQPRPGRFSRQSIPIVLFGIPWTAFAIFWMGGAYWMSDDHKDAGPFNLFPLFGIPFVLAGIGMLSSPLWMRHKASRTVYAVTDRRAVVWEARIFGGRRVQSFHPDRLTSMIRNERSEAAEI